MSPVQSIVGKVPDLSPMEQLDLEFHQEMVKLYKRVVSATSGQYKPQRFLQAVSQSGGTQAVKEFLAENNPQHGFYELVVMHHPDLTVEAFLVDHPKYWPLFEQVEIDTARKRLLTIPELADMCEH